MKKRDVAVNAVVHLVFILLSCLFAGIFSSMLVKLADKFVELDFIWSAGIRAVALSLISVFFVFFFSYKAGYHTADFDRREMILSSLLASAVHFLLALVTVFAPFISGATKLVGGFITFGDNFTVESQISQIPMLTLALMGIVVALVYAGLLVVGSYVGVKKRLRDRAELLGENSEEVK